MTSRSRARGSAGNSTRASTGPAARGRCRREEPNDAHHISWPLILLRDDELSRRWLAYAERLPDLSRTQITVAMLEVYRGDIAGALARIRARAQKAAGQFGGALHAE